MPADGGNLKALNLEWVVGFNKDIDQGVHYLTDDETGRHVSKRLVMMFVTRLFSLLC